MSEFTEGICGDGAAILRDGVMMTIDQILVELKRGEEAQDCIFKINRSLGADWVQCLAENLPEAD